MAGSSHQLRSARDCGESGALARARRYRLPAAHKQKCKIAHLRLADSVASDNVKQQTASLSTILPANTSPLGTCRLRRRSHHRSISKGPSAKAEPCPWGSPQDLSRAARSFQAPAPVLHPSGVVRWYHSGPVPMRWRRAHIVQGKPATAIDETHLRLIGGLPAALVGCISFHLLTACPLLSPR